MSHANRISLRFSKTNYPTASWRPHLVVLRSGIQETVVDDSCHPFQHCQNQVRRDAESHPLGSTKHDDKT